MQVSDKSGGITANNRIPQMAVTQFVWNRMERAENKEVDWHLLILAENENAKKQRHRKNNRPASCDGMQLRTLTPFPHIARHESKPFRPNRIERVGAPPPLFSLAEKDLRRRIFDAAAPEGGGPKDPGNGLMATPSTRLNPS